MTADRKLISSLPTLTLLSLALLAAAPVWGPGLVNTRAGGDSPFLLWRAQQMAVNLRAGVFPVRWMPDAAYGYGYPFFSYYAALPFYVAGLLNVLGVDILTALKLTQTLGFILAAVAMHGWARRHFSNAGAWLAAVAYTFASFHLVNVYTRGDSLSEFYAFIFFPLILWGIDATLDGRAARSVVSLGLAFGGLFIAHNLSALIFSPFVALYALLRSAHTRPRRLALDALARCAVGLALGLALSAWCWAPFFFEKEFGQLAEQTTGYFNYSNHFRGLDFVQPTLAFDFDVGQTTPFAMSSAQAALTLAGLVVLMARTIHNRKLDALSAFTLAGLILSTFMVTPLSRPLWDHVPYLPIVQFPWRFLTVQAVFTALATAHIARRKPQGARGAEHAYKAGKTRYVIVALGLFLAVTALANLHPARLAISPAEVTTERLQLYEMFTANIGTTIRYEYLPREVVPRLYTSDALIEPGQPARAVALEGQATTSRASVAPTRQVWRVTAGASNATLAFPILWWPGWQATVDGQPAPIRPANSSGRILLNVASGEHTVVLWLGRTPLRAAAESASLIAALGLLGWMVYSWRKGARRQSVTSGYAARLRGLITKHGATTLSAGLICITALAIFVARSAPAATANDETMDFVSQPYLHHSPGGAELTPGWRLMNYFLSAEELPAGQTLNANLNWINSKGAQAVTLTLVSPAQHLVGLEDAPTLAQSVERVSAGESQTHHSLAIPRETARGIYLLKVQGDGAVLYLRPVRVRNERPVGDLPIIAQFGDRIRLHGVRTEQTTPTQLSVTLDWSTAKPVEANYAIAVRLSGAASIDTQPGYGFLPTSLWRPGELVTDRYTLKLPEGTPPRNDYEIEVILYDAATLAGIGQYVQPGVALTLYARRPIDSPTLAHFGPEIALASLDLPAKYEQGAPVLTVKAGWLATAIQSADRAARWTVYDSKGTAAFTQTFDLAAGLPSSAWPAGAFVSGETPLNVPAGQAVGIYRLGVTVLNLKTQTEEGSYLSPSAFEVVGHPRSFTLPTMAHRADVNFGQQIKLLGYDVKSQISNAKSQISLMLYWQALAMPQGDYKVFVHLFDPADEQIAAQHDAMPFDNRYPTSWWVAGEVISETVTLDLKDVKPGTYRLAAGLYEPRTVTRLAAVGPNGARLDADRAILPEAITVPK